MIFCYFFTSYLGAIVFALRGNCTFLQKVLTYQALGASGVVVGNNDLSILGASTLLRMGTYQRANVTIPSVFISTRDFIAITTMFASGGATTVRTGTLSSDGECTHRFSCIFLKKKNHYYCTCLFCFFVDLFFSPSCFIAVQLFLDLPG
jgi:hypothetical protein